MAGAIAYSRGKTYRIVRNWFIRSNYYGNHKQTARQIELGYNLSGTCKSVEGEAIDRISMGTKLINWFKFIIYI